MGSFFEGWCVKQMFCFEHIKPEVPVRHPNRDV